MRHVIGIDPGEMSGWAVVTRGLAPRLVGYGEVELGADRTATEVLGRIIEARGVCVVAIEEQYVAKNIRSTIVLAQRAGRWIEAAAVLGCTTTMVNPKTWQAAELGLTRAKRAEIKRAAAAKVKGLYSFVTGEHANDAVLIARYCALTLAGAQIMQAP